MKLHQMSSNTIFHEKYGQFELSAWRYVADFVVVAIIDRSKIPFNTIDLEQLLLSEAVLYRAFAGIANCPSDAGELAQAFIDRKSLRRHPVLDPDANDLVRRASVFAAQAHSGILRKYTQDLYITHSAAVACILSEVHPSDEMLAAAWLHDVVEDTAVTLEQIRLDFGDAVAHYVGELTKIDTPGSRAKRVALECTRLAGISQESKTIKVCDILDNVSTVLERDPGFARTYLAEKAAALQALSGANEMLWRRATNLVQSLQQQLPPETPSI